MMELPEEEAAILQSLCQDAMALFNDLPAYDFNSPIKIGDSPIDESPQRSTLGTDIEVKYLDSITQLNAKVDELERDKRSQRVDLNNEKAHTAELLTKIEELEIKHEELKEDIKALEKYKKQWENSINVLKQSESQSEYLKQLETEVAAKKATIEKLKKEVKHTEKQIEVETSSLRDQIEQLEMKNIELLKNENLVKMFKLKLDGLKHIKQEKREIEIGKIM
jgi:chromosome segregation ATPase